MFPVYSCLKKLNHLVVLGIPNPKESVVYVLRFRDTRHSNFHSEITNPKHKQRADFAPKKIK